MANEENLTPWEKGKSGNPNGRPKGLVSSILATLKEEGELVTKKLVTETYQVFLSLPKEVLRKIEKDKSQPMINRIIAENMLSDKGFEIIEKMIDRANGKPTQTQEVKQTIDLLSNIEIYEDDGEESETEDKNQ